MRKSFISLMTVCLLLVAAGAWAVWQYTEMTSLSSSDLAAGDLVKMQDVSVSDPDYKVFSLGNLRTWYGDTFLDESSNLSDLTNATAALANLGAESSSTANATYLNESANLSDLDNATAAKDNLDLGTSDNATFNTVTVTDFTRYKVWTPADVSLGATPPTRVTVGDARTLYFDADAELAFLEWYIPSDWNDSSNMTMTVYFTNTAGDAITNGSTVEFEYEYYSKRSSEVVDAGTAVSGNVTYTQTGGNGIDKEINTVDITIDWNATNQPLAEDDIFMMKFNRDMTTDTYANGTNVILYRMGYTADTFLKSN